jgi:hypothetical protein
VPIRPRTPVAYTAVLPTTEAEIVENGHGNEGLAEAGEQPTTGKTPGNAEVRSTNEASCGGALAEPEGGPSRTRETEEPTGEELVVASEITPTQAARQIEPEAGRKTCDAAPAPPEDDKCMIEAFFA